MGENEELALKTLAKNKEIHEKFFLKFHSTYHKQIGDGFLAIFDSVLEAIYASAFIQDECKKNKIPIRTGIHQGEVIFKDQDVFGDEVNITSRIENAAKKNSIYVSENVKKILVNKTGISIEFVKACTLKNVKDPINLYKVEVNLNLIPSFSSSNQEPITQGIIKKRWFKIGISVLLLGLLSFIFLRIDIFNNLFNLSEKQKKINLSEKSIAVLPFQNNSNDSTMDYLGDGFADNIILYLSKIPDFTIIARSSSFRFKKSGKSTNEIAKELGVQNILEGSFQTINDDMQINLNLIHGSTGEVLFADSYNGRISELFQLQDDVAENITNSLVGSFLKFPEHVKREEEVNLQAFKYYQYGQSLLKENYLYRNTIIESREQFRQASKESPDWSAPYVGMAESYFMEIHYGYNTFYRIGDSIEYYISKASIINPEQGELDYLRATVEFWSLHMNKALELYNKAIELNPNYPHLYYYLGWINLTYHNFEKAILNLKKAKSLDPLNEYFKIMEPVFYSFSGRHEEAVKISLKMLDDEPGKNTSLFTLGVVYTNMKEYDKALNTLLKRSVGHTSNFLVAYNYAKTGQINKAREILEYLIRLPEDKAAPTTQIGVLYLGLGDYENAIKSFQKGLKINDLWPIWMEQSWTDPIKNDPRYIELMNSIRSKSR